MDWAIHAHLGAKHVFIPSKIREHVLELSGLRNPNWLTLPAYTFLSLLSLLRVKPAQHSSSHLPRMLRRQGATTPISAVSALPTQTTEHQRMQWLRRTLSYNVANSGQPPTNPKPTQPTFVGTRIVTQGRVCCQVQ